MPNSKTVQQHQLQNTARDPSSVAFVGSYQNYYNSRSSTNAA